MTSERIDLPGYATAEWRAGTYRLGDGSEKLVFWSKEQALAFAAALQQQQPQARAAGKWQESLDNVPKDGTPILVDTDGDGLMTARWNSHEGGLFDCVSGAPFYPDPYGWCSITRWMLIPAAPTPDQGSVEK